MNLRRISALAVAAPLLAAVVSAGDLTIVSKVTSAAGASTSTVYFSPSFLRSSSAMHDSIVDLAGSRMITLDNNKKEYWEMTFAEMNAAMQSAQSQMSDALSRIPPEQLKMMPQSVRDKLAGAGGNNAPIGAASVTRGTGSRKIAGYDCDQYLVAMDESIKMEIWATKALQPPTPAYYDSMRAMMGSNPMASRFSKIFEEMKKIQGFPLAQNMKFTMMGQTMETTSEATDVKTGAIPASTFEIPAGYKKVESPMKRAMAAHH
jgi:Domain of unknown function (DUF4412)